MFLNLLALDFREFLEELFLAPCEPLGHVELYSDVLISSAEPADMGDTLTQWIHDELKMDARLTILGHIQRGGSPSVRDRLMASKFAVAAVDSLHRGEVSNIMVYRSGSFGTLPIHRVADSPTPVDNELVRICTPLSR